MALAKDELFEAIALGKKLVGFCHEAGDAKGEADALCRLATIYLGGGKHEQGGKVAEMALAILYGINDQEAMTKAKQLVDSSKHAQVAEEIEVTVSKMSDYCHVPQKLIVDPGLQNRVQTKYLEVVK